MTMHAREMMPIRCNVLLIGTDPKTGREVERVAAHNLVVTAGKVLVAQMLADESGYDTGLTYCEVGTGSTAAALSDTALQTSTKRNAVTLKTRSGNVVQYRTFYAAADVTALIKEVGLFGHSTAGAGAGTGVLFNRAIVTFDNTAGTKDLTVVVEISFG